MPAHVRFAPTRMYLPSGVNTAPFCPQVKKIANGQPEDVVEFIERTVECNHWAGEEPYDRERAEQITKAIKNARCDGLVSEEQALKLKYKKDRNILDAIKKAKDLNI